MLRQRTQFLAGLLFLGDLLVLAGAWLAAFAVRFSGWPVPVYFGVPEGPDYMLVLFFVPPLWALLYRVMNLYRPRVLDSSRQEALDVVKAAALITLCLLGTGHFLIKLSMSRIFLVYFWVFATVGLLSARVVFRRSVRALHDRGHNLRQALIVGTEALGQRVREQLELHPDLGLNVKGFVSRDPEEVGGHCAGLPVVGHVDQLQATLRDEQIDLVLIALPNDSQPGLDRLMSELDSELVDIKVIPDLYKYSLPRGSVEEFEGLPIISLNGSPLVGWNRVAKRLFDLSLAVPSLILTSPLIALIALLVKLTSRGPVLYVQERMGLDGRTFRLAKFRTMEVDAERDTGPVWASNDDPRRTRLGSILRRTSLDELPQLWNVIKGEMSLVGPRPERPVFIENFKKSVPKYMLRHKVKAGITGWAQVNGWRGNTSVQKRLEHDLYYIQHWSLRLDTRILWLTLFRGFLNPNAY